ncbi:MAG: hypothetical protein GF390_02375 [Candidatus Pacebacteria bacterium]|nr:hypothetical protein [Candidatus Paceibacterota bacterium]
MHNINFLKKRQVTLTKVERQDKKWLRYSLAIFSLVFVAFLGIIAVKIALGFRANQLAADQQRLKKMITDDEAVEVAFLIFANKLEVITEIFQTRSNKQAAIRYFDSLFSSEVFIKDMTFEQDGQILALNLVSSDVFVLEEVFNSLQTTQLQEEYKTVSKSNIRRSDDGSYALQLTVTLKGYDQR